MAEDFLIRGGIDLSAIRSELKQFERELIRVQDAGAGTGNKVPVLPPAAIQKLNQPTIISLFLISVKHFLNLIL